MESCKVETRTFHGSWGKRNRPGRAEEGVSTEREGSDTDEAVPQRGQTGKVERHGVGE